ncbi:N,N'-diacetylchitobiose transport system substrate-binding protein [Kitasatospora gansuensis]|uniref:N,N'-diacetylchitobiose transport system substrate-binding protein n=1 Tax=Kitasatospora gansuensis TaxID=258050 RepID=A0A7W7SAQ3_9ACTN|nr:extracellular solute-binding protein [Kitasatospora gansuensis]MBB4947015.1 N,N'-diacetylchitobiose transport system substrate-binding protein [Kitasatospora gansuensis]
MKRQLIAAVGVAAMVVGLAACGSDAKSGGDAKEAAPTALTVWLTVDAQQNWPDLVKSADDAITAKYPGIKINHEYYGWKDKNTKLDSVLATDAVPDVVEMGNTEMLPYMIKGALAPLDASKFENSGAWLDGLKASATYNGKTYGVPYYAGARVATWRKDIAADAGVTAVPTTYADLTAALDKIQAKQGDKFSAWYQPSRDWYTAMSFVTDAGGSIAKQDGDKWKATLSSPESVKGLTAWKDALGKYMKGDLTKDDADRYIVYGLGSSNMIYGSGWEGGSAADPKFDKTGGKLKENIVSFVMPGPSGKNLSTFLGGSDLAVPVKSKAKTAASEWINAFTNSKAQEVLIKAGNLPNNKTQLAPLKADPKTAPTATAAEISWFVPTAPGWLQVEKANVLQNALQDIAQGKKTVEAAAKDADTAIDGLINKA